MADVGAVEHSHALVAPKALVQLTASDIDGDHPGGACLQQAVGESAGRRARIEGRPAADVDSEVVEGGVELLAAAADEPRPFPGNPQRFLRCHQTRRLLGGGTAHCHPTGGDVGSGPLPAGGEAPTDELGVEPPPQRGQAPAALELELAFLAALAFFDALLAVEPAFVSFRSRRARSSLVAMPSAEI